MIAIDNYLLYILAAIVATLSPGPAVILAMSNSFKYGVKKSIIAILGNITALFILAIVSVSGIGIIITTSPSLFALLKFVGGVYLIYLGIKIIRSNSEIVLNNSGQIQHSVNTYDLFKQAFVVAISNPKALIFLMALFPQFINASHTFVPQFLVLITTLMFFSFSFLSMYALLARRLQSLLNDTSYMRLYNYISGGIFVVFGIFLISADE